MIFAASAFVQSSVGCHSIGKPWHDFEVKEARRSLTLMAWPRCIDTLGEFNIPVFRVRPATVIDRFKLAPVVSDNLWIPPTGHCALIRPRAAYPSNRLMTALNGCRLPSE